MGPWVRLTSPAPLAMRFHPGGSLWCTQPWAQGHNPAARTFAGLAGGEEFPGRGEDPGMWIMGGMEGSDFFPLLSVGG